MSSGSTLPKSVQAQIGASGDDSRNSNAAIGSQDRIQQIRDFIDKYRLLPDDFLRVPPPPSVQAPLAYTGPLIGRELPLIDVIDLSVVEAQLVKNYGLLRMDLYCNIRVGHMSCETQACLNGAKNPKWDFAYRFVLKPGIDSFHVEIYNEKQFSPDDKIAWLNEPIPPEVFQGITVERWFPLSGRLGPNKEGSILLVISHRKVPMGSTYLGRLEANHQDYQGPLTVFVPAANQGGAIIAGHPQSMAAPVVAYRQPHPPTIPQVGAEIPSSPDATVATTDTQARVPISEEDVNQLSEMFPSIDKAIIRAILQNNNNDKESSIGALLALG